MILQVLITMIAGWLNRHQQQVIAYLLEENRTPHAKLGGRRIQFTEAFDQSLRHEGVEPLVLPPRSPNLNAHCERFVRSIKEEALDRMIFIGEGSLRYAIRHYMTHYQSERNHQGWDNQRIAPEPGIGGQIGEVRRRERLGGLLSYYYREAA